MPEDRLAPLRKALLVAAKRKLHIGVAVAALVAALAAYAADFGGQLLPLATLSLGLLAYLAMVALDATDPAFIRAANSRFRVASDDGSNKLEPSSLRDPEIRDVYANILLAFANCQRTYETTSDSLRSNLEDGLRRSAELVGVAGRAARRGDAIYRHLEADSPSALTNELGRLRKLAEQTSDDSAKKGFLQAADAKTKELETYRQLEGLRDRIHAQLKLIEASLDGLSAKLVKLEASDLGEAISINESISEHVQTMTNDVEILEATYEETMQEFRA